jgi:hypothetical protein
MDLTLLARRPGSRGNTPHFLHRTFAGTAALLLVAAAGCAPGEEEIQQKWDDFVADHNACSAAADCTLIFPGCPLGCFVAVSADSKSEAELEASELIEAYESGGRGCDYDCLAAGPVACVEGRCEVEPEP